MRVTFYLKESLKARKVIEPRVENTQEEIIIITKNTDILSKDTSKF
jgi:hypothetical protein